MKKFENIGKSLGKKEQKEISGGGPHDYDLWCQTQPGGSFTSLGQYPTKAACHSALWTVCGVSCLLSYCTTDLAYCA